MSITATQVLEVYQKSFVNGDAKLLKVITTDNFEFVMTDGTSVVQRGNAELGYRILNSGSMIPTHFMRAMKYWSDFTAFQSQTINCPK